MTEHDLPLLQDSAKRNNYPEKYDPSILQRFKNPHNGSYLEVQLVCPEFTSLCEITQQPDFGRIEITYGPNLWCVESKSLKLYLFGFRNHMAFHENAVGMIGKDLISLLNPLWLIVRGFFNARGGISINPIFQFYADGGEI